jgi:hypothetical protein
MQIYPRRTMEDLSVKTVARNGNSQNFPLNFERALQRAIFNGNIFIGHYTWATVNILLLASFTIFAYTKAFEGKKGS